MNKTLLITLLLTASALSQTWSTICNTTGSVAEGNLSSTCSISSNFPAARGYNWANPYDSYNHEIMYYGGESGGSHPTIYSFNLWGYSTSTHHFTLRVSQEGTITDNTSACGYNPGSTNGQNANPTGGHPLGMMAFDSAKNVWISQDQLCQSYNNAVTSLYDATTHLMKTRLIGNWGYISTASCLGVTGFGCAGDAWNNGMVYVPAAGYTYQGTLVAGGGSSAYYAKFDGVSTWTNITSTVVGSDGPTCSSGTSTQCPPYLNGAKLMTDGTNIWLFGGCNGSVPGNGSGANKCSGTNNVDLFKGVITGSGSTITWTKISPAGGIKPPNTNSSFPMVAYDSVGKRFVFYADTNTLWQYVVATNTWSTLSATGSGPVIDAFLQDNASADSAAYDPSTGVMVFFYSRGQSVPPGIFELQLSNPPTTITTITTQETTFPAIASKSATAQAVTQSFNGLARTNEPITTGIPLTKGLVPCGGPDPASCTGMSGLGLAEPSVGQFKCLGVWNDNSCRWVLVDTQVPSLLAGGTSTLTLQTGAGNFGGSNMATDGGASITVNTGAATFTIRKANFDLINKLVISGTTLVDSSISQSDGMVLSGPVYPATTCSTPPTDCVTLYKSANDSSSTATIEENGPAKVVIKATGSLIDGSGNLYLRYTARMYFYYGKNYVKVVSALRNADTGPSTGSFATAFKQYRSYEARVKMQLGSGRNALFATHSGTQAWTFTGSENAYEYQAYSTSMQTAEWNASDVVSFITRTATGGTPPYTYAQDGYQVVQSGSTTPLFSGNNSQYSQGWGDLRDSTNAGVMAGFYQMSAYWPKSVQFMSGGTEVRLGIWPDQSLMQQTPTSNIAYAIPYPQHLMDTFYLDFHIPAISPDPDTEFKKLQYFLVGRAPVAWYNSTDALWFKLTPAANQDTYYGNIQAAASPAISASKMCCSTDFNPSIFHRYGWNGPGGDNSSDFRYDYWMEFIERGWTGRYLWAYNFNKFILERTSARADGFTWRTYATQSALNALGQPTGVTKANTSTSWTSPPDGLHSHFYGIIDWYFGTGDGFYKDFIDQAIGDQLNTGTCANTVPTNNSSGGGYCMEAQRAIGINMNFAARWGDYGTATNQSAVATQANTVMDNMFAVVKSPLAASGTDTGVTYTWAYNHSLYQYGTNTARGVYVGGSQASFFTVPTFDYANCANGIGATNLFTNARLAQTYQNGMIVEGLGEMMKVRGTGWTNYYSARELGLGIGQWATKEAIVNNTDWTIGGFRYSIPIDHTCSSANQLCECSGFYAAGYNYGNWPIFSFLARYAGDLSATWLFERALQRTAGRGGSATSNSWSEQSGYGIADAMYWLYYAPPAASLQTVTLTSFTDNGGGSYTLGWTPATGVTEYRLKYKQGKSVVDWLNFDVSTSVTDSDGGTFGINPATNQPWFSSTYNTAQQPSIGASTITVTGLPTGMTSSNFMLKAMATGVAPVAARGMVGKSKMRGTAKAR